MIGTTTYDNIIVGAGTAGCVAAARLAESSDQRTLLIEAGHDDSELVNQLRPVGRVHAHSDWRITGQFDPNGRQVWLPRGKVVGGSSLLQGGIALRSCAEDYSEWASVADDSWSYDAVLPLFKELENDLDFATDLHGQSGPLRVRRARRAELQPIHHAFIGACIELGQPWCDDLNAPDAQGIGLIPLAHRNGTRENVRDAYLARFRQEPSLSLLPNTHVDKILLTGGRAVGVQVIQRGGQRERVFGGRVLLCAGAVGTPAILLRSGIGPAQALAALGIDVQLDAPGVGQELRDHPTLWLEFGLERGHGEPGAPWFQVMLRHLTGSSSPLPDCAIELHHDFLLAPSKIAYRRAIMTCALLGARGTGHVGITSPNPLEPPLVRLGYTDPDDGLGLSRILELALALLRASPFGRINPKRLRLLNLSKLDAITALGGVRAEHLAGLQHRLSHLGLPRPGTSPSRVTEMEHASHEALLRGCLISAHHLHGSCRMGSDSAAVVDAKCRVNGAKGLYIADASVIPIQLRANTHIPVIMIAEKVAASLARC